MTNINLEQFCDVNDETREWIKRPFSHGAWTYATNGHIAVRVPRRDDIPENPDAPVKQALRRFEPAQGPKPRYKPAPKFELIEPFEWPEESTCGGCYGTGKQHQCPDCKCVCKYCNGAGKHVVLQFCRTKIGSAHFQSKYISWIAALPQLEIGRPHKSTPMAFRFDGGEGLLMPVSR